jgi:hypothetical protein
MATYVYTQKEFEEISLLYQNGQSLDELASLFSKSVQSIRMKLVKAGLYTKTTNATPKVAAPKTATIDASPQFNLNTKSGAKAAFKHAYGAVGEATL